MSSMTIRQCMTAATQLLNQYSIAGTIVPLSYNDKADDENRMVNLINDAQMAIATGVKPIDESFEAVVPETPCGDPLGEIPVDMPEDFNHFISIYFTPASGINVRTVDAGQYKWLGDRTLLLPSRPAGTYRIFYNRYPVRYYDQTDKDNTVLDNTPDTHPIIPYFVAAMISLDENPKTYYALYNIWETRLARLGYKPAHAVSNQIVDVYGFNTFGGLG